MSLDAEGNPPLDKSVEMEEDTEYQRQLALFVRCSTEKGIELLKIGEIIAGLSHRRYFFSPDRPSVRGIQGEDSTIF